MSTLQPSSSTATSALLQRSSAQWVRDRYPQVHACVFQRITKLTEELGEFARAVVGEHEQRPGRGDPVQEAAQIVIVLLSIFGEHYPYADLYAEVEAEMRRGGAL